MKEKVWTIGYHNDVGADDEGFWEWWSVTNGDTEYKCNTESDAKGLLHRVNNFERLVKTLENALDIAEACEGEYCSAQEVGEIKSTLAAAKQNKLNPTPSDSGD